MAVILLVDNDENDRKEYKNLLEKHGYKVDLASTEEEARSKLKDPKCDLAILDVRLNNDGNDKDISGLVVARDEAHFLPKIILTNHQTQRATEMALRVFPDGIPPAITIVQKGHTHYPELLAAIPNALSLAKIWQGMAFYNLALQNDYKAAQDQAKTMYRTALVLSLVGAAIILAGMVEIFWLISTSIAGVEWMLAAGTLLSTIAGIVTEGVGLLFFRRVDAANERMDHYHRERIAGLRFDLLFNACANLSDAAHTLETKKTVILQAAQSWLCAPEALAGLEKKDGNL